MPRLSQSRSADSGPAPRSMAQHQRTDRDPKTMARLRLRWPATAAGRCIRSRGERPRTRKEPLAALVAVPLVNHAKWHLLVYRSRLALQAFFRGFTLISRCCEPRVCQKVSLSSTHLPQWPGDKPVVLLPQCTGNCPAADATRRETNPVCRPVVNQPGRSKNE